jgi:hypothetical protein
MDKKLSEMSNEELWQLFPIILCDAYTKAKTDIIIKYTEKAKNEYGERYGGTTR